MDPASTRGWREPPATPDSQSCIPLSNHLKDSDIILLLTPGVIPELSPLNRDPEKPASDPFGPLGKALARHHPRVRHVPYLPRNGITGTHVVHIRLAAAVVFVVSGPPRHGQPSQVALAEITKALCEHRPLLVLACCDPRELGAGGGPLDKSFPTLIQVPSLAPFDLEATADVLFGKSPPHPSPREPHLRNLLTSPPTTWPVEVWDPPRDDVPAILDLWRQCIPSPFSSLTPHQLHALLRRDGYAMHYTVREPGTGLILGFCATYTTYADSGGDRLLGSLALLLVRPAHRRRGVGRSLHDHALRQLARTRGVCRLQLGSAFPRLLYGLPADSPAAGWFRRRGWPVGGDDDDARSGAGQEVVCDWLLKFKDWPATGPAAPPAARLAFRPCEFGEFEAVLGFVEREARRKDAGMGWYDQYAKLAGTMNVRDIVVGWEDGVVIATALTYARNTGSLVAEDLPWAGAIGEDVGGVTCVCVSGECFDQQPLDGWTDNGVCWKPNTDYLPPEFTDEVPNSANRRDAVMIRLLDSCIGLLASQGMNKLLIDAVKGGDEGFQSMGECLPSLAKLNRNADKVNVISGFQKWATYRDVWRDA